MFNQFAAVLIFILLAIAFVVGSLVSGWFIRLSRPGGQKHTVYECGEPTIGSSWIRYNSRFYNIGLVFLLFDVEVVLLIPAVLMLRGMAASGEALAAVSALLIFLGLLIVGLVYEWYWGNLDWIRDTERGDSRQVQM